MRSRNSESFIVLPLLPIFLLGAFPYAAVERDGPCRGRSSSAFSSPPWGLTEGSPESNSAYSEQIIVHGYARGT